MTLPSSGQIAASQVNVELDRASNANFSLGEPAVRNLAGVPSGQIKMSDLWGKTYQIPVTPPAINTATPNYNARDAAVAAGWNGVDPVRITVVVNAVIGSNSAGSYAFDSGTLPAGSSIILNIGAAGLIVGKQGQPATADANGAYVAGANGGPALRTSVPLTLTNNGIIGGGGGAGGSQYSAAKAGIASGGGGGGNSAATVLPGSNTNGYDMATASASTPAGQTGAVANGTNQEGSGGGIGARGGNGATVADITGEVATEAGVAIQGNSLITYAVTGAIYGARQG
jgi:hypothetical protein